MKVAVKRKVQEAYRYMSEVYYKTYRFDEAGEMLEEYINLKKIDTGNREDTMSEQNMMIRKNGKVKCIIFKE